MKLAACGWESGMACRRMDNRKRKIDSGFGSALYSSQDAVEQKRVVRR